MISYNACELPGCCGVLVLCDFEGGDSDYNNIESGTYDWEAFASSIIASHTKLYPVIITSTGNVGISAAVVNNLELPGRAKSVMKSNTVNPSTGRYITICTWTREG